MEMDGNSKSVSDQSKVPAVFKYEDALIDLANARYECKKSIVKYMDQISEAELHKLKKQTYQDTNLIFSEPVRVTNETKLNQITKQFEDTVKIPIDILTQTKNLKSDGENMRVIIQKLEEEREYVSSLT